jgi:hypothetical protein
MELITTLATIPAVIALVTMAKDLGLPARFSPLVAVGLGVALVLFDGFATATLYDTQTVFQLIGTGIVLGLGAAGLYDGARVIGGKKTETIVVKESTGGDHAY